MEIITNCPVCSHTSFDPYLVCTDYLVSQQAFSIQQCRHCGLRLTNPRPDKASIGSYYKSDQYVSHTDAGGGLINTAYRMVRNYTLRQKLHLINTLCETPNRILDVGCGTGAFLSVCRTGGWQIAGTEPDDDARAVAVGKLGIEIKSSLAAYTDKEPFDVITLWHVLEHIANLNEAVEQLHNLLTERGRLLIAVPNSDSYDAYQFKQHWAAYDTPRHLYHFTPSTLKGLFEKHGIQLLEQRPMLFDAFYIALLSTRYQTGSTNYLKSVQMGLTSNSYGKRTGNYSSNIYILRKTPL